MRIGILGGGQLGMYLAKAAHRKQAKVTILDTDINTPAMKEADYKIVSAYDDHNALLDMLHHSDMISYEFENVKASSIDFIEEHGGKVIQGKRPLEKSQHRFVEKEFIRSCGLKTVDYQRIQKKEDVEKAGLALGYPFLIKTCSGGYDGKGQWTIQSKEDEDVFTGQMINIDYIAEAFINFKCELSCIAIRSRNKIVCFEAMENIHKNGILHISLSHARVSEKVKEDIKKQTLKFMEQSEFYGIITLEYFLDQKDQLYVNELAPRPHNSGHLTMDAYSSSQYDLAISSLLEEEITQPKLLKGVIMLNVLGQHMEILQKKPLPDNAILYDYGKLEARENRKMAHICFFNDNIEIGLKQAEEYFK